MARQEDIQKLIKLYSRRLQKLREEEALKGLDTPPATLIQIEDIEAKLAGLRAELETTPGGTVSPLSDDDLANELVRLSGKQPGPSSTQTGGFNLSHVSGSTINIGNVEAGVRAGGDVVGGDKINPPAGAGSTVPDQAQARLEAALAQWRRKVTAAVAALSELEDDEKRELNEKAARVVQEAGRGQAANLGKLERLLNTMSAAAPGILAVTVTSLQAPLREVGLVLEQVDDRIKLEQAG